MKKTSLHVLTTMIIFHVTEMSTSTDPSTTPTVHRDKTITTSATQTDSTPAQGTKKCLQTKAISM